MMILVNLLPGRTAGAARGRSAGAALGPLLARVRGVVGDQYLAIAVAGVALAAGAVGWLHTTQEAEAATLAERESVAVADSTRHATLIAARARATAQRDSVERQLGVIAAIDSNRYVWAHLLDEMSRALPAYTWLTSVQQTSAPPAPPAAAADSAPRKRRGAEPDTAAPVRHAVTFRVVGQTVDIQALTTFMRDLEASPFVRSVTLARSEAVLVDGKDVTEFTLDGEYQAAPRVMLRTESITVPVR